MTASIDPNFAEISVLVVDDQDYVRSIVSQLLKRLGIGTVLEAGSGSQALEIMVTHKPDIILCDVKMQPIDGLQFLKEVRSGRPGVERDTPIIFLTSASDRATVQAAMEGSVDGYLVKPVSAEELRTKLQQAISHRKTHKGVSWKPTTS